MTRFLSALCERLDCEYMIIIPCVSAPDSAMFQCRGTMTQAEKSWFSDALSKQWPTRPLSNQLKRHGSFTVYYDNRAMGRRNHDGYVRDFLRPLGICQEVMISFVGPRSNTAALLALRRQGSRRNVQYCKDFMRRLLPQLTESLNVSAKLRQSELMQLALQEALRNMSIGTFILDGQRQLINGSCPSADEGDFPSVLNLRDRRLYLEDSAQDLGFQQAIADCACWHGGHEVPRPMAAFRIARGGKLNAELLVQPAPHIHSRNESDPHVLVCLSHSEDKHPPQDRLVAQLFGLGLREAQLAVLVADGNDLREAARLMGVTHATVKTYLQRVFSKTGLNRQTELVQLILKSVAVLA